MAKQQTSFQGIFELDAERKRKEASRKKMISFREYLDADSEISSWASTLLLWLEILESIS
ncbi:MAG: hypothetical protein IH870_02420 [Chloroflexi bacterium]|nr:hypothetical protein [Chloroflexota bacterium]